VGGGGGGVGRERGGRNNTSYLASSNLFVIRGIHYRSDREKTLYGGTSSFSVVILKEKTQASPTSERKLKSSNDLQRTVLENS